MSDMEIVPSGASLGAEVRGIDVRRTIDPNDFKQLTTALASHLVLRIRNQTLDADSLVRFSRRFGKLDPAPTRPDNLPDHTLRPEINVLSNIIENGVSVGGLGNSELVWHQDMTYKPVPPKANLLYALEAPKVGGDTLFYNLGKAYDSLPAEIRTRIDTLNCKHDATRNSAGQLRAGFKDTYSNEERPGAVHPLVIRHSETGKKSLYLGRRPGAWIVGLPNDESETLLDRLWQHIQSQDHTWVQKWRVHDLVIWDNRFTLHRRDTLDPAQRRLMFRTQVRDAAAPIAA